MRTPWGRHRENHVQTATILRVSQPSQEGIPTLRENLAFAPKGLARNVDPGAFDGPRAALKQAGARTGRGVVTPTIDISTATGTLLSSAAPVTWREGEAKAASQGDLQPQGSQGEARFGGHRREPSRSARS